MGCRLGDQTPDIFAGNFYIMRPAARRKVEVSHQADTDLPHVMLPYSISSFLALRNHDYGVGSSR